MNTQPAIKWSGSKRTQAKNIVDTFLNEIDVYHEPFCGGCSVLMQVLNSNIKVNQYICSDINVDLINLWNAIIDNPSFIAESYETMWNELNKDNDVKRQREYYCMVRERFNKTRHVEDFMFIMRTTTNGMPRYNSNGDFNNSFHLTRSGIKPSKLNKIIKYWSETLTENNVNFVCQSYNDINPKCNDFMYLDPPYANTKGMYYGGIDLDEFWIWLKKQQCSYALSFNGKTDSKNMTYEVPIELYNKHKYLFSGKSSFRRIITSEIQTVYESLYIKTHN